MKARILLLPGDGVGPEVIAEGRRALEAVAALHGHEFALVEGLIGFMALDATGAALPAETEAACRLCDAVLVGAVGGPVGGEAREGLRELCRRCELHSNLLHLRPHPALRRLAPVRPDLLAGVDLLLVRDRTGAGNQPGVSAAAAEGEVADRLLRVIRAAFRAASRRHDRLSAVEPSGRWLGAGRWRSLVERVADGYPDVALEHVGGAALEERFRERPARLDVILACGPGSERYQRTIAGLAGSAGLLPSASLGDGAFGVFEPAHGAATALVGSRRANPTATLLSAALLLRHSLELEEEASALERAVHDTLDAGQHTADIAGDPSRTVTTGAFADAVLRRLAEGAARADGHA